MDPRARSSREPSLPAPGGQDARAPTADGVHNQIDTAFPELPGDDRQRFATLVESIQTPRDVSIDVSELGDHRWTVAISTADFLGALSIVVGAFTAYRLSVLSADILTLQIPDVPGDASTTRPKRGGHLPVPMSRPPVRRLLDVFDVRALTAPAPDLWPSFRADVAAMLATENPDARKDDIIGRVSEAIQALAPPAVTLLPMTIEVINDPAAKSTRLAVRSADTPGFLFAFANALADFTINIERAEIRTIAGEAQDTFWVTDVRRRPVIDDKSIHELRVATTLIKQFTYLLPRSPNPGQALRQFNALVRQMLTRPTWTMELARLDSPLVLETLADLMGVSRFLWEDFLRMQHESLFPLLLDAPALAREGSRKELWAEVERRLQAVSTHDERVDALNVFKDREMFRIDLRHIVGRSDFETFSHELTELAEVALASAGDVVLEELSQKYGRATLADGRVCPWCACALGKFGGGELGFGSDLEIILIYADDGRSDGSRSIVNGEYFIYFAQSLLRTLRARQEGIFEIDLRLRPYGRAGAMATSLGGFADYYSPAGAAEQFERLALVRLRPVAGDLDLGARIQAVRDGFVYSDQPIDLANILHLRHRQATELVPRGQVNAKYSAGGLVDVEYYVQAKQISAGAGDHSVRVTNTLEAIRRLVAGGYLPADQGAELRLTYDLLRRLIDGLRVVRGNAKDLTIPPPDAREFAFLARRLKYESPETLQDEISRQMAFARALWNEAPPPGSCS
jgi:glutamate-ammonia-ligase adenylyltransferase